MATLGSCVLLPHSSLEESGSYERPPCIWWAHFSRAAFGTAHRRTAWRWRLAVTALGVGCRAGNERVQERSHTGCVSGRTKIRIHLCLTVKNELFSRGRILSIWFQRGQWCRTDHGLSAIPLTLQLGPARRLFLQEGTSSRKNFRHTRARANPQPGPQSLTEQSSQRAPCVRVVTKTPRKVKTVWLPASRTNGKGQEKLKKGCIWKVVAHF